MFNPSASTLSLHILVSRRVKIYTRVLRSMRTRDEVTFLLYAIFFRHTVKYPKWHDL